MGRLRFKDRAHGTDGVEVVLILFENATDRLTPSVTSVLILAQENFTDACCVSGVGNYGTADGDQPGEGRPRGNGLESDARKRCRRCANRLQPRRSGARCRSSL